MNSKSRVRKPKPLCSKNTACRATGYPAEGVKKKKKKKHYLTPYRKINSWWLNDLSLKDNIIFMRKYRI